MCCDGTGAIAEGQMSGESVVAARGRGQAVLVVCVAGQRRITLAGLAQRNVYGSWVGVVTMFEGGGFKSIGR